MCILKGIIMQNLFLVLVALVASLPLQANAAIEWAVWSGYPSATTRTGTFSGGQTVGLVALDIQGVGSNAAGAAYTSSPAVMGMAPSNGNPPYQQIKSGPAGVLIISPGDPIMGIDLTGLPVGTPVVFGISNQKFTYQLELRDAALALLPLTGIVVTPYNITYPPIQDFPNGLVADQNSFLYLIGGANQIRRDALNDALPTSNFDQTGLTVFSNLPTATRYIALKAQTSSENEGLDIYIGADLAAGVVVITDDAGAAGDGAVPFGNVTRNTMDVHTVTVTNHTAAPVAVSIPTLPTAPFAIADSTDCTLTLAPATECTITVSFTPGSVGAFAGNFSFDIGGTTRTIALSGTGTQPNVTYIDNIGPINNDKLLDFAATVVTGSSGSGTLTVTNTDAVDVAVNLDVNDLLAGDFSFQNANSCNVTLSTGQHCTLTVIYTPTVNGVVASDHFTLNVAGVAEMITVSGTPGLANADFQISQAASSVVVTPNATDGSQRTTFTLTVRNNGPDLASAVVTDHLPTGLIHVSDTSGGSYDSATGVWQVGALASGSLATLQITADATTGASGCIANNATVATTATSVDSSPANNSATVDIGAPACADVAFAIGGGQEFHNNTAAGDVWVSHRVVVTNKGPNRATGVRIIIDGYSPDPATSSELCLDCPASPINVGDLEVNESRTVIVRSFSGFEGTLYDYSLSLAANEPDPDAANNNQADSYQPLRTNESPRCFVTTAAIGSSLYPELKILRQFRDRYLLTNPIGRAFVAWYYRVSPAIATTLRHKEWLRVTTRTVLTPVVYAIKYPAGLAVLLLNLVAPLLVRRFRRSKVSAEGRVDVHQRMPGSSK